MAENPGLNNDLRLTARYKEILFTSRDWMLLALSLIPAALFAFGDTITNEVWLGIYTPLFHLATLLLAIFSVGKKVRSSAASIFLFACDAMLILFGFIHRDLFLCCANCLFIPALTALSMLSAAGVNRHSVLTLSGIYEALCRSLRGLFEYIPLPFSKLAAKDESKSRRIPMILLSLCICIPILAIVLLLLSSADEVFFSCFDAFARSAFEFLESPTVLRVPLMLIAALMIFSWMFTLRLPGRETALPNFPRIPGIFPAILLPMLNLIYALFVYIQFANLFGGTETAAMTGGYAQYARSGFFQLVTVSVINLCVLALSMHNSRSIWIRMMSALLISLTGVILVSAFWRMRLYIEVYGLSVLRVMTLWGMLAIAALLIVSAIALVKSNFRTFSVGLICVLILWVGLNAIDIDRLIAEYNVFHYLSGDLTEIDLEYLESLSPSAQKVADQIEFQN